MSRGRCTESLDPYRQCQHHMLAQLHRFGAHHLGVCPPRLSVSVFFASLPSLAAQYALCFPMVRLFGRFFARSTTSTSVPISGPSTDMSAKMPAVCGLGPMLACLLMFKRQDGCIVVLQPRWSKATPLPFYDNASTTIQQSWRLEGEANVRSCELSNPSAKRQHCVVTRNSIARTSPTGPG